MLIFGIDERRTRSGRELTEQSSAFSKTKTWWSGNSYHIEPIDDFVYVNLIVECDQWSVYRKCTARKDRPPERVLHSMYPSKSRRSAMERFHAVHCGIVCLEKIQFFNFPYSSANWLNLVVVTSVRPDYVEIGLHFYQGNDSLPAQEGTVIVQQLCSWI